jgi:hypothetical protein
MSSVLVLMKILKSKNMKPKTKQKRLLKKDVFEELSCWDLSSSETIDLVLDKIQECGDEISEILSNYFLRWESIKVQRDEIIRNLENQYPEISNIELKKLIIEYIKEYWNSENYKSIFGEQLTTIIEIQDVDY